MRPLGNDHTPSLCDNQTSSINQQNARKQLIANMSLPTVVSDMQGLGISENVTKSPFPAATKQASGTVNGTSTAVSSMYFSDKILITISQAGRLSQWV